ncbi:DUF6225 family protein [Streptomyces sp. BE133]|uniref:DUF6225 family protein n=1 Tax=Streptomyces sp. BE133 TaxID=3002523 RepID=UPI002E781BF3|nr:DUF6225 family protein [Streptomyces sp. BE133]MEE1810382.1 DUF6225 family protein [Streptomyces sp. BE133]
MWNAAQLREAIKDLPDDTPIHIGVAEDPGCSHGYRSSARCTAEPRSPCSEPTSSSSRSHHERAATSPQLAS